MVLVKSSSATSTAYTSRSRSLAAGAYVSELESRLTRTHEERATSHINAQGSLSNRLAWLKLPPFNLHPREAKPAPKLALAAGSVGPRSRIFRIRE